MTTTAAGTRAVSPPTADAGLLGHPHLAIAKRVFRDVRITATVIGLSFGAIAASAALTYVDSFPTAASRRVLVRSLSGDAGFSVLFGRVDDIDTVGGYTAYKSYVFLTTIGAIWAMLAVTRLLRGEEDSGRWQLLLAGRTNPAKALLATMASIVAAMGVVLVGTTALTMIAGLSDGVGFSAGDSIVFGVSIVMVPVVFAAAAALCSQVARNRRLATALSMGVFALAFVLRMIGDASPGSEWVLWTTPLGWSELVRPFTANDLLPLVPAAALSGAACFAATVLASRRDVGSGLLAATDTAPVRPFGLSSSLGLATRLSTPVLAGWAVGIATVSFVFGIVAKAAASAVAESSSASTVLTKLGATGGAATRYVSVVFLLTGTVLALFPASQIGAARDEEASGRLTHIVAARPSRREWFAGRLAIAAAATIALGVLTGVATWAGAKSQGLDLDFGGLIAAGLNVVPAALLALSIGSIALALIPRFASAAIYFVVGWSIIIDLLGSLVSGLGALTRLSLFHYVSLSPAETPNWTVIAIYMVMAAILGVLGVIGVDHRDLTTD